MSDAGCFWCAKSQIEEIERQGVPTTLKLSYDPCTPCSNRMSEGIALIEVDTKPIINNQPTLIPDIYSTGRWLVVDEEFLRKTVTTEIDGFVHNNKMFLDIASYSSIQTKHEGTSGSVN